MFNVKAMSLESLRQQLGAIESFTCFSLRLCFVLYFCFAKGLAKAKCGVVDRSKKCDNIIEYVPHFSLVSPLGLVF